MRTSELHPRFGLEISGIDVLAADDCTIDNLRRSMVRYGFLVIRRQVLDDNELVAFGVRVGSGRLEESARPTRTVPPHATSMVMRMVGP